MTRLLFICSRNRWRSPTAETVFAKYPGVETASAGLADDAENPLTPDDIDWADVILVMERAHEKKLAARFGAQIRNKRVICLGVADKYRFMDPELVALLREKVPRLLGLATASSVGARVSRQNVNKCADWRSSRSGRAVISDVPHSRVVEGGSCRTNRESGHTLFRAPLGTEGIQ